MTEQILKRLKIRISSVISGNDYEKVIELIEEELSSNENYMYNYLSLEQLRLALFRVFKVEVKKADNTHNQKRGINGIVTQMFCYIARKNDYQLKIIARFLNYNHTTVIYLARVFYDRISVNDMQYVNTLQSWRKTHLNEGQLDIPQKQITMIISPAPRRKYHYHPSEHEKVIAKYANNEQL